MSDTWIKSTLKSLGKPGLSLRLLGYIVLCSACLTLVVTLVQLYIDYRRDVHAVYENIRFIEQSYLHSLAASAYDVDAEQVRLQLQGALTLSDIEYLAIIEHRTAGETIIAAQGNPNARHDIVREFTLEYPDAPEGPLQSATLRVIASLEGVYRRLWTNALILLASNVGMIFLAALCIFLILQFVVTRHILKMANYLQHLEVDTLDQPLCLERRHQNASEPDELDTLVTAFNDMQCRIHAELIRRQQAEREIRILNEELESRVARRTAALEAANNELKDFAYVVSHDLKAPLRGISRLADWLTHDYADVVDEQGKDMAALLINRVKRMDNLIDGILEYSRIGRIVGEPGPIVLNTLLPEIIESLAAPEHIHIVIEHDLPVITGDRIRISQVFQNLLSNAIHYMDKAEGTILVRCTDDEMCWRFAVSDNGPGIEERHYERIFKIFQTLTSKDKHESTGVGLAIVKKIVEFYGGKIWLDSEVGQGSTFLFTFPKHASVPVDPLEEAENRS